MIALKGSIVLALLVVSLVPASENPSILIDTGHGGYPLTDGRLFEFRDFAKTQGFSVDFKDIKTVNLHTYCLVVLANPDVLFSPEETAQLKEYVDEGGTLFLTGSGDFDNRDHSEVTNPLLQSLGSAIKFNDDQLTDIINAGKPYIPLFDHWNPHPLTAGLPPISLYSPGSLSGAYPLLLGNQTTHSEDTDTDTIRDGGGVTTPTPTLPLTLLAVERLNKGDLLVGGSWGFLSGLDFQGHREFAEQLLQYASKKTTISNYVTAFKNAAIVTGDQCRPEVDKKAAEILSRTLGEPLDQTKTIIIGGPHVNAQCLKINPYLPIPFRKDSSWFLTKDHQPLRGQEYGLVAVITVDNRTFLVAAGLGGTGTTGAVHLLTHLDHYALTLYYSTYGEAVLFKVSGDATLNGVKDDTEYWEIFIL